MSKILIIEDEKALISVLSAKLKSEGFEVLGAENGAAALEILETETPDLIFLDIVMPEMNGFEFMKSIKGNERLQEIPIYILSNLSGEGDINTMQKLDVDGYLVKADLDLRNVVEVTNEILQKHGKETASSSTPSVQESNDTSTGEDSTDTKSNQDEPNDDEPQKSSLGLVTSL